MKTFLVFVAGVISDLGAMIAASSISRDADLSRGDIAGSICVGGPIGGEAALGKRFWTVRQLCNIITK